MDAGDLLTPITPPDAGFDSGPSVLPAEDAGSAAGDAGTSSDGPSDALYRFDEPMEVEVTVAAEDWELIRKEGRTFSEVYTGCNVAPNDYTVVSASVRIDGQLFENVGLRKKGFLGSLSVVKPSLRIELDEYVHGQELLGEKIVTLNNNLQDRSFTRTCMAYQVFEAAGVPAPRCAFARVTVNGQYLGTYSHVEAIKKPFLARRFGNDGGDLYEGTAADFTASHIGFLEKKTNEDEPLSPELKALIAALDKPDDELLAALEPLVDLESFMRFWAVEGLIAHGDSYSGNLNNFFVYVHPDTRKIHFIPWGTDGAFLPGENVGEAGAPPTSFYAAARLPRRLYAIEESRERYRETLRKLLAEQWDEQALLAQVDRIGEIVGDEVLPDMADAQRKFVRERRAQLAAELDGPAPTWEWPERQQITCHPELRSDVSGGFRTVLSTPEQPDARFAFENAFDVQISPPLNTALKLASSGDYGRAHVVALTMPQLDGSLAQLILVNQRTDVDDVLPGTIEFHGFETFGILLTGPSANELKQRGFISDGTLTFAEYGPNLGDMIGGTFAGSFIATP